MSYKTVEVNISGIVQGVGFRPFIFNLARNFGLKGSIFNRGNAGVRLILQGELNVIDNFIENIQKKRPEISFIENIDVKEISTDQKFNDLKIEKSEKGRGISLTLPPDVAICDNCLNEMRDPNNPNYHMYPFIACATCGPRYTTVTELPYDRERSTMIEFPFCESCNREYSDFDNRRFHAQTFACSTCGPNYKLYNKLREEISNETFEQALIESANRIREGDIIAVKGIGGVHLVCLAEDDDVLLKLRKRKGKRKYKPFALMIPNLDVIKNSFYIHKKEKDILASFRRPIVLLEKKKELESEFISDLVAPGLNNIGFMLPYMGIHYLLFDLIGQKPLVYTSGNKSSIPMGIENNKIFDQLQHLADYFLLHNRKIHQRADDSVLRIHDDKIKLIRRSRGYVPEYLSLPFEVNLSGALATGPELATTGAVLRGNRIFPTQHIGNVTHLEAYEFLKNALFHMKTLLQIQDSEVRFIACDAHPSFVTTNFAKELSAQYDVPLYPIQHHFAHVLGLMAENKIPQDEKIIGISTDGVGYGDDGNVWGGEILLTDYRGYERVAHLEYQPMIGGDRCTKYPARMVASILLKKLGIETSLEIFKKIGLEKDLEYKETELNTMISQFKSANNRFPSENIPLSSSTGRIFDCISYLLGASNIKTYRGEPAMRLEGLASQGNSQNVDLKITSSRRNNYYILNTSDLILDVISMLDNPKVKKKDIAAKFQKEIGTAYADLAIKIADKVGVSKIGLTGGVAYNQMFSKTIKERVIQKEYIFLEHNLIAPGDAGISTGQLIGALFKHL
ncbi:MAG: carbamoyltransferase HypF [Promethearchaeota archaeon]